MEKLRVIAQQETASAKYRSKSLRVVTGIRRQKSDVDLGVHPTP